MTYTIEQRTTPPAIIATWHDDFDFMRDARTYSVDVRELLNAQESPVYYIMNIGTWQNMSFNELLEATSIAAGSKDANFHNPNNIATLIITNDRAVAISADGLKSDSFGNANVLVFSTLDDALAFAQQEAA